MIISRFQREPSGEVSEVVLNTGEVLKNVKLISTPKVELEEKTITKNGTYTSEVGFGKIVVKVSSKKED